MSEHQPAPHNEPTFEEIVQGIDAPSIESQQEILKDLKERHQAERDQAAITREVLRSLPDEILDNQLTMELGRSFIAGTEKTNGASVKHTAYIKVLWNESKGYATTRRSAKVDIATLDGNELIPANGYTPLQAKLVFDQLEEIAALRSEGILPNLGSNLYSIKG